MASGGLYHETTLQELKAAAVDLGVASEIKSLNGDTILTATLPHGRALVQVHSVKGGPVGEMIVFAARAARAGASEAQANAWNRVHNFATVSVDGDGTPWIAMQVAIHGGVSKDFLRMRFAIFDVVLDHFHRAFGP